MINVNAFLPVIALFTLQINTNKQNTTFIAGEIYPRISGSLAARKFDAVTPLILGL